MQQNQQQQPLYEVQYITRMKVKDEKRYFRIKWKNYPTCQNTWQPQQHLNPNLIKTFLEQQKQRQLKRQLRKCRQTVKYQIGTENNILQQIQIQDEVIEMLEPKIGQDLIFIVRRNRKKQRMRRNQLIRYNPEILAKFYRKLYLKKIFPQSS